MEPPKRCARVGGSHRPPPIQATLAEVRSCDPVMVATRRPGQGQTHQRTVCSAWLSSKPDGFRAAACLRTPGAPAPQEKLLAAVLGVRTCGELLTQAVALPQLFSEKTAEALLRKVRPRLNGLDRGRSDTAPPAHARTPPPTPPHAPRRRTLRPTRPHRFTAAGPRME